MAWQWAIFSDFYILWTMIHVRIYSNSKVFSVLQLCYHQHNYVFIHFVFFAIKQWPFCMAVKVAFPRTLSPSPPTLNDFWNTHLHAMKTLMEILLLSHTTCFGLSIPYKVWCNCIACNYIALHVFTCIYIACKSVFSTTKEILNTTNTIMWIIP